MGQTLDSKKLEDRFRDLSLPPKDRVVDLGEIFRKDAASRGKLSERLEELNQRYQFSVYYVAYSGIIGSSVDEKAVEFRDSWLGAEEEGLIFVCDTDMKTMAYALTKVDSLPIDGGTHDWKLPDHEVIKAMLTLSSMEASGMAEEEFLTTIGHRLVDELNDKLETEPVAVQSYIGGILGAIGIAAGLGVLGVWWVLRTSGSTSGRSEGPLFPRIEIPNRLGAPFGGGVVGEISFSPPPPTMSDS